MPALEMPLLKSGILTRLYGFACFKPASRLPPLLLLGGPYCCADPRPVGRQGQP